MRAGPRYRASRSFGETFFRSTRGSSRCTSVGTITGDSNGPADADARLTAAGWWLSQHLRVYQLWMKVRLIAAPNEIAKRPIRVPLDVYEANLREIARLVHRPRRHGRIDHGAVRARAGQGTRLPWAVRRFPTERILVPLSHALRRGTRRAAAATGAMLCDAAQAFDALPGPKARYFKDRRCPPLRFWRCRDGQNRRIVHCRHGRQVIWCAIARRGGTVAGTEIY